MRHIASLFILMLLIGTASANQGTITIYGTNASNAQSNLTRVGTNATVNVSAWAVGDAAKTFTINVSDLSDTNNITLGNFTAGRIIEVKVNGTSYNAYLASAQGEIKFNRTQNNRNQTYTATPALNANYNLSWIAVNGVVSPYLPLTGGTMTGSLQMLNGILLSGGTISYGATGIDYAATSGATNRVVVSSSTNALIPAFVSTSRPAYNQGGIIFNTTTQSLEFAGDNNAWASLNHFRNISTNANLTARATDTVYQNANSTPMYVSVAYTGGGNDAPALVIGSSSTPTLIVSQSNAATATAIGVVPSMHYYRFNSGDGVTLQSWSEIQ